jgi:hypothetical protein
LPTPPSSRLRAQLDAMAEAQAALQAGDAERAVTVLTTLRATYATGPVDLDAPFAPAIDCATVLGESGRPEEVIARLGPRLGGVRLVDLLRSGLRGPILEPGESRLDALAVRMAIEVSSFAGLPVLDARQWQEPRRGIADSARRWAQLCSA